MKKALLILLLVTVWIWHTSADAQTKRKVVFGVPVTPPNVVHIPPYVAKELGFFAENNIDVEFVTFEGGTQTLRGSVAGGLEVMSRAVLATCGLTPKDVQYIPVSTKGRVPGLLTNQIDTAILHVDQAIVAKKKKPELNILVNLWEPLPKWLYAAYIAPEKEIASNRQLYIDIMAALIKANRYIYNNKAKVVEIATKYTQQDGDAVAQTYDILANAGAWPVNDGLPKDMVEWTVNKQVELGTIKADDKPSYEKLVDVSIVQAALAKAGGRLKGDKRWD